MKNLKKLNVFVAFFLAFAVFTNGAMAEACFCGQTCRHALQAKTKIKINSLFHMRCLGTLCKSCDLEEGQTLKATNTVTQTLNVKILDAALIPPAIIGHLALFHVLKDFGPFYMCESIPSSPAYLRNLSILI